MSDWKKRLNTWLTARSNRERWLVYGVAFVLVLAIGDKVATSPLQLQLGSTEGQIEASRKKVGELQIEIAKLSGQLSEDPNRALRKQIATLKEEHADLDNALRELTVGLIQPSEMTRVLREMLTDEKGLRLLRLANAQGEPVALNTTAESANTASKSTAGEEPRLYRHALVMEVEGSYLDALRYLKRLEALPWTFYWDGIDVSVEHYPKSRITIRLSTLGLRKGWIGV